MGETNEERRRRLGLSDDEYREGDIIEERREGGYAVRPDPEFEYNDEARERERISKGQAPWGPDSDGSDNWRGGGGSARSGGGGGGGSSQAYSAYLQPQRDPLLERLVSQLEAQRQREEQERAQIRELVMAQLGEATTPVTADSPHLKPVIDAQKLALQRGAQRQRSAAVERAGPYSGRDSGALDTRINQIEQGRGESEAAMIGQILYNEAAAKKQQVMQLLDLAVRSGDAAAARTLQGQLQTLNEQLVQTRFQADVGLRSRALDLDDSFRQADLGFRRYAFDQGEAGTRYRFDNDLAFRLAQLQLLGNQNTFGFLEGLL